MQREQRPTHAHRYWERAAKARAEEEKATRKVLEVKIEVIVNLRELEVSIRVSKTQIQELGLQVEDKGELIKAEVKNLRQEDRWRGQRFQEE